MIVPKEYIPYYIANQSNPIDRDLQIILMIIAKERHQKRKQSLLLALANKE